MTVAMNEQGQEANTLCNEEEPWISGGVLPARPGWVTPDIAREMADQVLAACWEAGYPEADKRPIDGKASFYFLGAPHAVLHKAGALVAARWGIEDDR